MIQPRHDYETGYCYDCKKPVFVIRTARAKRPDAQGLDVCVVTTCTECNGEQARKYKRLERFW